MSDAILLVEDELFIALDLEDVVTALGYRVDGPYARVADAARSLDVAMPRAAVLDVQLLDGEVFSVAKRLRDAGVPIIFHSGHADAPMLHRDFPNAKVCSKPCSPRILQTSLEQCLQNMDAQSLPDDNSAMRGDGRR